MINLSENYNVTRDRFLPPLRREEDLECDCGDCNDDWIICDPQDLADRYEFDLND